MAGDDRRGGGAAPPRGWADVRTRIAVGAVGAAAVLGVGAYTITSHLTAKDSTATQDAGALAPIASASPEVPSVAPSAKPAQAFAESVPSAAASSPSLSPEIKKKIDDTRAKAKSKQPVTKALPQPTRVVPDSAMSTRTSNTKDGYVRITTAHADLTDQGDQRIAADHGTKTGDVSCTQHFHFASNVRAKVIPNMMICWRVSASRSVVTLGVNHSGKPSPSQYAAVIDREWTKLR